MNATHNLVDTLMQLPIFQSEWVLWLLIALSVTSIAVMVERAIFYLRHSIDVYEVKRRLTSLVRQGDYAGASNYLGQFDSLETNVVLSGLQHVDQGPEAVEDLIAGALGKEKERYERSLTFLATIGNNAPFIGLFGTVLGIIKSFQDLSGDMSNASAAVMSGISEALIATAVGLVVAIPAVIAFNSFKTKVKSRLGSTDLLARALLSHLKASADLPSARAEV